MHTFKAMKISVCEDSKPMNREDPYLGQFSWVRDLWGVRNRIK